MGDYVEGSGSSVAVDLLASFVVGGGVAVDVVGAMTLPTLPLVLRLPFRLEQELELLKSLSLCTCSLISIYARIDGNARSKHRYQETIRPREEKYLVVTGHGIGWGGHGQQVSAERVVVDENMALTLVVLVLSWSTKSLRDPPSSPPPRAYTEAWEVG